MTLAGKVVRTGKSLRKKKTLFSVSGRFWEGIIDQNINVFLIFFCFHLDSSGFQFSVVTLSDQNTLWHKPSTE